jgi:hypothetical protein
MLISLVGMKNLSVLFTAYSHSNIELKAFRQVMEDVGGERTGPPRRREHDARGALAYFLQLPSITALGHRLGLFFHVSGKPRVEVELKRGGRGSQFRCERIIGLDSEGGCIDFTASGRPEAMVTCGILASQHHWFGGEAHPGCCSDN